MSNEFKFRVWEEREKAYNTWTFVLDTVGNLFRNVYGALIGCNKKDYIIEPCTGLKDKNNKDIYEGDIIGIYQEYGSLDGNETWEELEPWGVVTYEEDKAMFGVWAESPFAGEDKCFFELGKELEVIGNIHENPELLNGEGK